MVEYKTDYTVFTGRRFIYTDETEITADNVVDVLRDSVPYHNANRAAIEFLQSYRNGLQPILFRNKTVRPEINNKIVVNRADEIISFKVGYAFGEPVQYVARNSNATDSVTKLNEIMLMTGKETLDREIAEWFYIGGIGYRMVLPPDKDHPEVPLKLYSLDPRTTFVVHANALGMPPVMSVTFIERDDGKTLYSVYTEHDYFEILDSVIIKREAHALGALPVVEYYVSTSQVGCFEKVLGILDAINLVYSDRVNGVEQFVSALMKLKNADISEDDFDNLKAKGLIKINAPEGVDADLEYMIQDLNQSETQVAIDDMYKAVLTICGMPNRNGGFSTSDTGSAVILRDGWELAEAYAKSDESMFKRAEKQFLKVALSILRSTGDIKLELSDIDIKFTRRNYENINEKATVLTTMLGCDKIHPHLAFEHCGMFSDVENAYTTSKKYADEQEAKAQAMLAQEQRAEEENDERTGTRDLANNK